MISCSKTAMCLAPNQTALNLKILQEHNVNCNALTGCAVGWGCSMAEGTQYFATFSNATRDLRPRTGWTSATTSDSRR